MSDFKDEHIEDLFKKVHDGIDYLLKVQANDEKTEAIARHKVSLMWRDYNLDNWRFWRSCLTIPAIIAESQEFLD